MSLFNVPVSNPDLYNGVWIQRKGLSAQVSCTEVARQFLDTLPSGWAKPGVSAGWQLIVVSAGTKETPHWYTGWSFLLSSLEVHVITSCLQQKRVLSLINISHSISGKEIDLIWDIFLKKKKSEMLPKWRTWQLKNILWLNAF